jgi:hypothetical protein
LHFHFLWPAENLRSSGGIHDLGRANYLFIIVVISYDTAATAHWTLMFIVRAFINYTITVAVWTRFSFHLQHHAVAEKAAQSRQWYQLHRKNLHVIWYPDLKTMVWHLDLKTMDRH